jgi:hypothetical protein
MAVQCEHYPPAGRFDSNPGHCLSHQNRVWSGGSLLNACQTDVVSRNWLGFRGQERVALPDEDATVTIEGIGA